MKYEKKFWNDKSRKKNEKSLKDEHHRNNKYNNERYKSQNNKYTSAKSNYTSFSQNLRRKNNYDEMKNKLLDKRDKNDYLSPYKKTVRDQKLNINDNDNLKNKNSLLHEKYLRGSDEKSSNYNFSSNFNNSNNYKNNNNYNNSSNYYSNSSDNNNNNNNNNNINDNNIDSKKNDLNIELNNLNLCNLMYSKPGNENNNMNMINMNSINSNVNNYNSQTINNMGIPLNDDINKYDNNLNSSHNINKSDELNYQNYIQMQQYNNVNNDFNTSFSNFYNSCQMNIPKNDQNIKNKNYDNSWLLNNENNSNLLNNPSEVKKTAFNNSFNDNNNLYISNKTNMIISNLKKCLSGNEVNRYSNSDNIHNELKNDCSEKVFANENNKNYLNNMINVNNMMDDYNSSNSNNTFFALNNENIDGYLQNKEEIRYNNRYNFVSNDDKSFQESSISNESSIGDINKYDNRDKINNNDKFFPKNKIEESLRILNTLQVDIERVCCYVKHFIDPPEQLFQIMTNVFLDKMVTTNSKIAIFYVYNHLIQELRNKYKNDLNQYNSIAEKGLQIFVVPVLRYILDEQVNIEMINKFYRCISIWNERNVYSKFICDQLKSLQKNPHKNFDLKPKNSGNQAHSLISNEFSKFLPLSFIFKMPSINNEHKKALENKILNALFNNISKETLKGFDNKEIEETSKVSDKVMRIFGQELILINSQMLELSSLISDNNEHLIKLQNSLEKLKE